MKIAFIHPSNPNKESTGATYSANKIVESLDRNHDLTVYCLEPLEKEENNSYSTRNLVEGNKKFRSRTTRLTENIIDLKEELGDFDVVYSYPMTSLQGLGKIAPEISAKTVITLNAYGAICPTNTLNYRDDHGALGSVKCIRCVLNQVKNESSIYSAPIDLLRGFRSLMRLRSNRDLISNIDLFVALTENVKEAYVEAGYSADKIKVVPPILDNKFSVSHESGFQEPFQLLHVGYLKKHKGVDRLIPIAEELEEISEKEFELTIVGEGPLENKLRKQMKESGLEDRIDLKGRIPNEELPEVYAKHDLFVYPGRWDEPFGRIFIESLAAGTPIISTPTGLTQELEVIKTIDKERDFTYQIKEALNSEELSQRSKEGEETVEKFKFENIIPRIEETLTTMIGGENTQ